MSFSTSDRTSDGNGYLTSTVFESKGSFQAGLSQPTRAARSVRLRYLGVISLGYWETPLSTPSMASMNSCIVSLFSAATLELLKESVTLYSFSQSVSTVGSSSCTFNRLAMTSWPKCLWAVISSPGPLSERSDENNGLVDEPGRGQFRLKPVAENLLKTALVMVESVQGSIVHRPDVDHDIACVQDCRVSGSDQVY